ncbi:MAG: dimethyl sulfoxide reductase anchor subunit [Clostridia bacterium]|nr:dimethyl sulfoxide reductase anchor subunit [Clostridia bacterium]
MHNEWPLIIFTLLIQGAVGACFVLLLTWIKLEKDSGLEKIVGQGLFLSTVLAVLGLVASFTHLGSPLNAVNAIRGFGSSWMSIEIVFTSAFIGLLVLAYLFYRKNVIKNAVMLGWGAVICGIIAIFAMARVYMVTIIPAWTHVNTLFAFYGTALLLGSFIVAALLALKGKEIPGLVKEGLKVSLGAVIFALAVQLVVLPLYLASLAAGGISAQATGQILSGTYASLLVTRWVLALAGGAVLAALILAKLNSKEETIPQTLVYSALVLVLAAEIIGRFLFYASAVPITLGF